MKPIPFPKARRGAYRAPMALLVFAAIAPGGAGAQEDNLVDRVVAIVGDSVVLLSDIIQRESQMEAGGIQLPLDGTPQRDSIRRQLIDDFVNDQVLLQAAARDTPCSPWTRSGWRRR